VSATLREVEIEDPAWVRFVESQPAATAFHRPDWARMVADCYGYRASALILADASGQPLAGLPLVRVRGPLRGERAICLPFTDNCAPLASSDDVLQRLAAAAVPWRAATSPPGVRLSIRAPVPAIGGWVQRQAAVLHSLPLAADASSVFRTFKKTQVQQRILKAERAGVTVRIAETFADVRLFYALHLQTRRRLGTPVQPLRFFRLLWDRFLATGLGFVNLAFHAGRPIAGAVFLAWNGTLIYKYSASDPTAWGLRPNNLVLWTAIRWGCLNGFQSFDFGRTDLDNRGLREFKDGWGTQEEPLLYSDLGSTAGDGRPLLASRAAQALSVVIRRSPPWVCRTLGEVLYRYAA
jgi:CelD/BcsL family acetyltransferase involved in cellulose biosynthesis